MYHHAKFIFHLKYGSCEKKKWLSWRQKYTDYNVVQRANGLSVECLKMWYLHMGSYQSNNDYVAAATVCVCIPKCSEGKMRKKQKGGWCFKGFVCAERFGELGTYCVFCSLWWLLPLSRQRTGPRDLDLTRTTDRIMYYQNIKSISMVLKWMSTINGDHAINTITVMTATPA